MREGETYVMTLVVTQDGSQMRDVFAVPVFEPNAKPIRFQHLGPFEWSYFALGSDRNLYEVKPDAKGVLEKTGRWSPWCLL